MKNIIFISFFILLLFSISCSKTEQEKTSDSFIKLYDDNKDYDSGKINKYTYGVPSANSYDYKKAKKELKKVLQEVGKLNNAESFIANINLAFIYNKQGNIKEANKIIKEINKNLEEYRININNNNIFEHLKLRYQYISGLVNSKLSNETNKKASEAKENYDSVLRNVVWYAPAYYQLGIWNIDAANHFYKLSLKGRRGNFGGIYQEANEKKVEHVKEALNKFLKAEEMYDKYYKEKDRLIYSNKIIYESENISRGRCAYMIASICHNNKDGILKEESKDIDNLKYYRKAYSYFRKEKKSQEAIDLLQETNKKIMKLRQTLSKLR